MQCVERAHICPGNPQPVFVEILNKRSRSSAGSKVAFVDSEVEVVDVDGCMYGRTVQRNDYELLCLPNTTHPKRCKKCSEYRSQLRVAKYRKTTVDELLMIVTAIFVTSQRMRVWKDFNLFRSRRSLYEKK